MNNKNTIFKIAGNDSGSINRNFFYKCVGETHFDILSVIIINGYVIKSAPFNSKSPVTALRTL